MAVIVDIHCHTFNGDDLPMRGFIQRVVFKNSDLGSDAAALADLLVQGVAPGYVAERRELDRLLQPRTGPGGAESLEHRVVDLDALAEAAYLELRASEPALMGRLTAELAAEEGTLPAEEGLGDVLTAPLRFVRWVKLFSLSRLDVAAQLVRNFSDEVDLYVPLLVDLGMGLYDLESTTLPQQMELHEKISRLSMLGRLPGTSHARIHPFMGFDPRRELAARTVGDIDTPLRLVERAVTEFGFIGVKLYPPMGWRPIGNEATNEMTPAQAVAIDEILGEFYDFCEREQVPITAHCNASNAAHRDFVDFSHPKDWAKVLERFPELHLNLGHFGGASATLADDGWPRQIARLAATYPYLYADVGNHRIDRPKVAKGYLAGLRAIVEDAPTAAMADRIMYGSDWYMLAALPKHTEFLTSYRRLYAEQFGDERTEHFMGPAALRFLGFDDPANRNAQRLRARYERFAPTRIPDWLAAE